MRIDGIFLLTYCMTLIVHGRTVKFDAEIGGYLEVRVESILCISSRSTARNTSSNICMALLS